MNPKGRVLVTDPIDTCRAALLVIRSLGGRGIGTSLMSQNFMVPSKFSRWSSESICCPDATKNVEGFLETIFRHVRTGRYASIFPLGDSTLEPISQHRGKIDPYTSLVLPSHESVMKALDKSKTLRAAEELGIPAPETHYVKNAGEAAEVSKRIRYPVVIKSRQSYSWGQDGKASYTRPFYVNSASELVSTYSRVERTFPEPMIQEYVPGHNINVALLFDNGEPRAVCMIREDRTIPLTGGNSVMRQSIPLNHTLLKYSVDLLRSLNWHGVAEVEFKVDSRTLNPKLMEVNARFWGSMNVAIDSGVDFPYLTYQLANGERIKPVFNYRSGVKYRWLNGDIANLFSTMVGKSRIINTAPTDKIGTCIRFLRLYERNMHYDGLTLGDPLPFFMDEALFIVRNLRLLQRARAQPRDLAEDSVEEKTRNAYS